MGMFSRRAATNDEIADENKAWARELQTRANRTRAAARAVGGDKTKAGQALNGLADVHSADARHVYRSASHARRGDREWDG